MGNQITIGRQQFGTFPRSTDLSRLTIPINSAKLLPFYNSFDTLFHLSLFGLTMRQKNEFPNDYLQYQGSLIRIKVKHMRWSKQFFRHWVLRKNASVQPPITRSLLGFYDIISYLTFSDAIYILVTSDNLPRIVENSYIAPSQTTSLYYKLVPTDSATYSANIFIQRRHLLEANKYSRTDRVA